MNLLAASTRLKNPLLPTRLGNFDISDAPGNFSNLIQAIISIIFVIGNIAFLFMFLWGAYQWITSGGDKDALQKAKNRISHAMIGLVVLLSLYAILYLLGAVFGLNLVKFNIPTL